MMHWKKEGKRPELPANPLVELTLCIKFYLAPNWCVPTLPFSQESSRKSIFHYLTKFSLFFETFLASFAASSLMNLKSPNIDRPYILIPDPSVCWYVVALFFSWKNKTLFWCHSHTSFYHIWLMRGIKILLPKCLEICWDSWICAFKSTLSKCKYFGSLNMHECLEHQEGEHRGKTLNDSIV